MLFFIVALVFIREAEYTAGYRQ